MVTPGASVVDDLRIGDRFDAQTGRIVPGVEFYLTSFKRARDIEYADPYAEVFSAAVYQPKGFNYPKLDFFDIRDAKGKWTRPRDFVDKDRPLRAYRDALLGLYAPRYDAIESWARSRTKHSALCCWCPYDLAAERQLVTWGTFVCHTDVIRIVLTEMGFYVTMDDDRKKMVNLSGQ